MRNIERLAYRKRILAFVRRKGICTGLEIGSMVHLCNKSIYPMLRTLVKDGLLRRVDGGWCVKDS